MPTSTYEQIMSILQKEEEICSKIITGDWNAVLGERKQGRVVGKYGLVKRNESLVVS